MRFIFATINLLNGTNMDIFEKDLSGAMVSPDEPGYDQLISTIFDTMATAAETVILEADEICDEPLNPAEVTIPGLFIDYIAV